MFVCTSFVNSQKFLTHYTSLVWRSIQHKNTTPLCRFRFFSRTSLLGKRGQICFAESLKTAQVFRLNFLYRQGGHPTLFWNKQKVGFPMKLAPLALRNWGGRRQAPPPHDSDHAECISSNFFRSHIRNASVVPRAHYHELLSLSVLMSVRRSLWWLWRAEELASRRRNRNP